MLDIRFTDSGVSHVVKKGLLLVGDVFRDAATDNFLFGDAGTATLLEYGDGQISGLMRNDGSGFQSIYNPYGGERHAEEQRQEGAGTSMDGSAVFEFSIREVPKLLEDFNSMFKKQWSDYDHIILHQANLMILKHIMAKLSIPPEKMPITIQKYGNTSGASVPVTIVDLMSKQPDAKEWKLLLSGFGVGLSWGAVSLTLDPKNVMPFVFTDYIWDENIRDK